MKKIVALVLSLVMALSLATVAFAAGTELYELKPGTQNVDKNHKRGGEITFVKENTKCHSGDCGELAHYEYTDEQGNNMYLVPCDQDDATQAIYKNDAFSTWVRWTTDASDFHYDVAASAQKATTAKPNCTVGQYLEDGYVDVNGNFYISVEPYTAKAVKLNVGGIIVWALDKTGNTDYVIPASHIFAKGVANDKTGYDVATCLICKGEFACTSNEAVATKNGYKISTGFSYSAADAGNVYDANKYDNGYDFAWGQTYAGNYEFCWQLKAGTTEEIGKTTDTTKDGVNSAKTFDAGIAMYVGMSLLSVAGSAVVIGKKKEF